MLNPKKKRKRELWVVILFPQNRNDNKVNIVIIFFPPRGMEGWEKYVSFFKKKNGGRNFSVMRFVIFFIYKRKKI